MQEPTPADWQALERSSREQVASFEAEVALSAERYNAALKKVDDQLADLHLNGTPPDSDVLNSVGGLLAAVADHLAHARVCLAQAIAHHASVQEQMTGPTDH